MLNAVQKAAYELIQADARFLYTLTVIQRNAKNISSNYIMMCQPYIGLFTDGAEQWCKKLGLGAPKFTDTEKSTIPSCVKAISYMKCHIQITCQL